MTSSGSLRHPGSRGRPSRTRFWGSGVTRMLEPTTTVRGRLWCDASVHLSTGTYYPRAGKLFDCVEAAEEFFASERELGRACTG